MLLRLPIEGMTCAACAARTERVLGKLDGMDTARVDFATEHATVDFDEERLDPSAIRDAIARAGFSVPPNTVRLRIEGMTCASCAQRIEKALSQQPGVLSAQVDFASEIATVAALGEPDLLGAIEKVGYHAHRAPTDAEEEAREAAQARRIAHRELGLLALSGALTLPLVLPMLPGLSMLPGWAQLLLATPVQILVGWRFYRGRGGRCGMGPRTWTCWWLWAPAPPTA